jgi:hypothetical protein
MVNPYEGDRLGVVSLTTDRVLTNQSDLTSTITFSDPR